MKVGIFTRGKSSHSYKWEMAFGEGLRRHGLDYKLQTIGDKPRDIDLGILWGVHKKDLTDHLRSFDKDYLVLERGYIGDRTEYTSCGFNGLNGNANFCFDYINDERLHLVQDHIQPIRETKGSYILIMGQIASDASVKHIGFNRWLHETYISIKEITDQKIYYRPHPLDNSPNIPEGLEVISGDLHDAMKKASCVVTLNSNSGVDAVLAGVPVISMDKGSMVYNVTKHHINDIIEPTIFDRAQWLREMSYCQWSIEEITKGIAWEHLKKRYL